MNSPILVTGGTGTLGRLVVTRLRDAGATVRVLSRTAPHPAVVAQPGIEPADSPLGYHFFAGDLDTGAGVERAVDGVATIVHCAGSSKGDDHKTRTLVRAAERAGRPHLVHISVVGAERTPVASRTDRAMFGYIADKRAAELVVTGSRLPWTILRATQFHELMLTVTRSLAKLPVLPAPTGVRVQPVAAAEVADRLAELALGGPQGLVPDLGGPRAYRFAELARAAGNRRPALPIRLPGRAAAAFRDGANLTERPGTGHQTWEEFLRAACASAAS